MWQQFRNFLSNKNFWGYYVGDYVADKKGKLSEHTMPIIINIHFNFEESYESYRSNTYIPLYLRLHNPKQLYALLHHYIPYSSGRYGSVTREDIASHTSKYGDLYKEIEVRNVSQLDINEKIAALSKYLTVDLKDIDDEYSVTYSNLNPSTLPLAMEHFQYLMLSLRTWSHPSSTIDRIDECMRYVMKEYAEESFRIHYVHDPWRPRDLSIKELRIDLNFGLLDENQEESKHTLEKVLSIVNIDKFKALLNHYKNYYFQRSTILQPSSAYGYLHDYTTYRNTLQARMEEALGRLRCLLPFLYIEEDKNNPLILDISYDPFRQSQLPFIIRYLELITLTFNIWNDDINDKDATDRFLQEVRNDIYPLVEDRSFGSFYGYKNKWILFITSNIFQLNLSIILKKHQHNFTETLHLEGSRSFTHLLDFFNYLPNDYLSTSNSPHRSIASYKDLLYIFDEDETDPSILNLYYYPLSNRLDTSLIVDHLITMVSTFKREVSSNPNDNDTLDQYLSSITRKLASIDTNTTNNSQLSIYTPVQLSIFPVSRPSTSTSTSSPTKPSSSSSRSSLRPLKTFWQPYQPSDNLTTLILNLRFLPFRDLTLRDDIQLRDTPRFLSILDHYDRKPDDFDCLDTDDQEVSNRIGIQRDTDGILLGLYDKIGFRYERFKGASICNLTYSKLGPTGVPLALLHLELLCGVFGTWSDDTEGGRVLDAFVSKARKVILPMVPVVSSMDKGWSDGDDKDDVDDDDPRRVSPADGRLGGASTDVPNLLEVEEENISMMEDVD